MAPYAQGKKAIGYCDRCGFQYPLHELKQEVVNLNVTNMLVCPECWDPDQPQNQLGRYHVDDPQALRNPRPPLGLDESRQFTNSQSGSPLKILNPQPKTFSFSGTVKEPVGGGWWDGRNLDGFVYINGGQWPPSPQSGQTGAISVITESVEGEDVKILRCPWPADTFYGPDPPNTATPVAYNGNTPFFMFWNYYGGGGNPKINMPKNRYVVVKMRVTSWGDNYPALYESDDPWHGFLYAGVTDPDIDGNVDKPYPFGTAQAPFSIVNVLKNPGFTGKDSELNQWKTLVWDVMDDSAGVQDSTSGSSWVQSAALGFEITCFRFDFFAYGSSVGNQNKVAFDIEYIKFTDTLD
jgi:hypothetical protein